MLWVSAQDLSDPVDYYSLIWRFARETIADVLFSKSVVMLRRLVKSDHDRTGMVSEAQIRDAAMHKDVALTKFQVCAMRCDCDSVWCESGHVPDEEGDVALG